MFPWRACHYPWSTSGPVWARSAWALCLWVILAPGLGALPDPALATEPFQPEPGFLVNSWHTESGLPDGNVTAIAQTPEGYLWIGTFRGLARFDGVRFTVFDSRREPALADDHITGLLADSRGRLWIASEFGAVVKLETGKFSIVSGTPPSSLVVKGAPRSTHSRRLRSTRIAEDLQRAIWIHDGRPMAIRIPDRGSPQVLSGTNAGPFGPSSVLIAHPSHQPWLSVGGNLHQLAGQGWSPVVQFASSPPAQPVLAPSRRGGLWIAVPRGSWASGGGRVLLFEDDSLLERFSTTPHPTNSPRSQVTAMFEDGQDHLWLGTHWGGLYRSNDEGRWTHPQPDGPLAQCRVTCLFEDAQGAIWVGTLGDGLHRLKQQAVLPQRLPDPAKDHLVNTVCAGSDGSLWLGTDGAGLFRFHQGSFTHFGPAQGLPSELVLSVFQDSASNVWCGLEAGLFQLRDGRFQRPPGVTPITGSVIAIMEDRSRNLWVGTPRGPACLQEGSLHLRSLGVAGSVEIRSLAQDRAGHIWIGTIDQGVFRVRGGEVDRFGQADGLTHPDARSLWCDPNGGVWVGTLGGGLYRFRDGRFEAITTEDGLPDDTINGMIEDDQGNLWCSTYNGIFGCSRRLLEQYQRGQTPPLVCRWLSTTEGLAYRACSGSGQPVISRDPVARIWCVNQRNLASFDPAFALGSKKPPNVVVESLIADGTLLRAQHPQVKSSVHRFEFHYTALHLDRPEEARFRYRLAGLDPDWIEAGTDRVADYSRLQPGEYSFEVMAAGVDGAWYPAAIPVSLTVLPQFWERTSLRVALALLVIFLAFGVAFLVSRARLRRKLLLLEMKESTDRERRRIAQDLHDDLGGSLTEIGILAAAAETTSPSGPGASPRELAQPASPGEPSPATQVRIKADSLVRALDEIVWAVNPRHDSASSLAEYLSGYTREFLQAAGIVTRFSAEGPLTEMVLTPEQRHGLFLAAKEALNNVVRHARAGKVRLSIRLADHKLRIRIEDDGCGFDASKTLSSGDGLSNLRDRLASLGGSFEIHSVPGIGTVVEFLLQKESP